MIDVPCFSVLMWPKPSGTLPCAPLGALGCPQRCQWHRAARGPAAGPPAHPDRAGSHRGPGACRHGRLGCGRPACRGCQPAASPGFRARHRAIGQDRCVGCTRAGAFCRRDPPDAAPAARRPDARAACPLGAPPATDRHADRGAEPLGGDERAPDEGYYRPYYVAQYGHCHAGPRPRDDCSGPARCGGKTTICCRVPRALGPYVPARCCWNSPSWGRSRDSRSRPWSAWHLSIATVGPSVVGARSGAGARMCAPCCT